MNPAQHLLLAAVRIYRAVVSPALGAFFGPTGGCRFTPTCSAYAAEAVRTHGAVTGSYLAAHRLCRCHPWGGCGHDPVPQKIKTSGLKAAALDTPSSTVS
ncbi:MAG: membrane protein insertion efficiency factor YidD [Verrucomicrobiota bacterium]